MTNKYRTQFFIVDGARLTAADVHEYYGVSIDDLLVIQEDETQFFHAHGYEVEVTRCPAYN